MIVPTATKVGPVATAAHRRCARTRQAQNANKDWIRISGLDNGMSTTLVGQTDAVNKDESKPDVLYQLDPTGRQIGMEQSGAGAGKSFLGTDGQGSVVTQVTTGNDVACAVKYEPFGNPIDTASSSSMCITGGTAIGSTGNSIWYRGQARDDSTGNYQLGTRTYNPATGTFTTPDAYRISDANTDMSVGVDPLTANTYTYVNGNPLNLIDPSGHYPTCSSNGKAACDLPPVSEQMRPIRDAQHAAGQAGRAIGRIIPFSGVRDSASHNFLTGVWDLALKPTGEWLGYRMTGCTGKAYMVPVAMMSAGTMCAPQDLGTAKAVVTDPVGSAKQMWHGTVDPFTDAIARGDYDEAAGYLLGGIALALSTKGLNKVVPEGPSSGNSHGGTSTGKPSSSGTNSKTVDTPPGPAANTGSRYSRTTFDGNRVYQRNDLIDPTAVDKLGRTNLERMQSGIAPLGPDGKSINLHHLTQRPSGAIAEITATMHQTNSRVLHINPNTIPSGIDRRAFDAWRRDYWTARAGDF